MEEFFQNIATAYPFWAPFAFIILRAVPIVVAPVPGIALDFLGLVTFGWKMGFVLAWFGSMLGSTVAFYIGRIFREPAVKRFTALQRVHAWEDKYSDKQKFWTLVLLRFATSPFFDYVSYAAGLSKVRASHYVLSTIIALTPLGLMFYYFGGLSLNKGIVYLVVFFIVFGAGTAIYAKRKKSIGGM